MVVGLLSGLVAVVLTQTPQPAPRPDFSGTWRLSTAQGQSTASLTITLTDAEVTVERPRGASTERTTYRFSTGASQTLGVEGGQQGRAYWNGAALVTEGSRVIQGETVIVRETRTLNGEGTEMTVERLVMVQHGYTSRSRDGRNYGAAREVFVRLVR